MENTITNTQTVKSTVTGAAVSTVAAKASVSKEAVVYGKIKIAPVEVNDGTVISKFNRGNNFSLFPKGRLIITNSVDKYGHYIEFISEKTFNDCVKVYNPKQEYRDFLKDYSCRLESAVLTLDLSIVHDRITYEFLKTQPCIALNKASVNSALHLFYIEDEIVNAKAKGVDMNHKLKAYSIINGMTTDDKRGMLRLYGMIPDSLTEELLNGALITHADNDSKKFLTIWEDSNRDYKILIATLVAKRILRRNGASYFYEEMLVGHDLELTVEFLKAPVNTELLYQLKKEAVK